ncbi:hypothetical protein Ccrd_025816 [Cynara cardunculus var. scolymus]|uniref:CRM domain-containing protein n=1 Tax=Cynara cardunculus var. scolymus TaxID=59895 RepID=A0A118JSG0_CYNCS|nr:hypothetical protein Ccrd_025816 [Cynara cardunculus var. scolymus]
MALVPTRLDSFHSSVYKLHVSTRLHSLRYSSYNPFNKHKVIASYESNSANLNRTPPKKSKIVLRNNKNEVGSIAKSPISQSKPDSGGWLEKWDDTHKQNWPKQAETVFNYRYRDDHENSDYGNSYDSDSDGVHASSSGSTMERIVEKLKKFGYVDDVKEKKKIEIEKGSIEDIFQIEEGVLPNARGGFSPESPLGVEDVFRGSNGKVRFPWEKPSPEDEENRNSVRQKSKTCVAELTLPEAELRRLRNLAYRLKNKTRITGAGVTREMVALIKDKWKSAEVVKLKIEGSGALNMRRMHEILERRTGGLVIWRSGSTVALYRGVGYIDRSIRQKKREYNKEISERSSFSDPDSTTGSMDGLQGHEDNEGTESTAELDYEKEVDKLLEGLGPRYTDWPGCDPLPVDADLLPGTVHGYQPPFRILPYGLWERSSIAKVALKRGVQLTTSERMAEDIKKLTGGILLSRNKDFLVFYRGKDFLSPDVSEALLENERLAKSLQDQEEQARLRAATFLIPRVETQNHSGSAGTLSETLDANARWAKRLDGNHKQKVLQEAETLRQANLIRKLERKLRFVEAFLNPVDNPADPESLTDEERFMFRKLVENMHLHWKYRELVKIIIKTTDFEEVKNIALSLESESNGVLVSVDKVSKGYAIIVFRGKDYSRPSSLRPKNLLTKRKALERSIELQRHEALMNHISTLHTRIRKLQSEIEHVSTVRNEGDEELYDRLDATYSTEDEDSEKKYRIVVEDVLTDQLGDFTLYDK